MSKPQKSLFSLLSLCKNVRNRSKFDKVLTKNKFAQFFCMRHGVDPAQQLMRVLVHHRVNQQFVVKTANCCLQN